MSSLERFYEKFLRHNDYTERMVEAGKLLDILILDHIIITHTDYLSFREERLCEFEPLCGE